MSIKLKMKKKMKSKNFGIHQTFLTFAGMHKSKFQMSAPLNSLKEKEYNVGQNATTN
jgi:hypothetical protein